MMNDSNADLLHFVSNHVNTNDNLLQPGENVTYYFEPGTKSILRHDAHGNPDGTAVTSIIINRISSVKFDFFDYIGNNPIPTMGVVPTANTGRVRITLTVNMEDVSGVGQIKNDKVILTSDVTLRNSSYMLKNY